MTASSLDCCAAPSVSPVTPPSRRRNQRPQAQPTASAASATAPQARFAPYALPGARAWGIAALAALGVGWACGRGFRRRLGGVTGDTLGAAQQVSELAVILAVLAMLGR